MSDTHGTRGELVALGALAAALAVAASVAVRPGLAAQGGAGSPGPHADSCGLNDPAGCTVVEQPTLEIYRPGEYPVQLPAMSLLGAPNDLPNPYEPGVHWGELPDGRQWGSTAGITTGPDNTIWVIDRCGLRGAGGTLCLDSDLDPILQFNTSGRLLNSFGRGTIVSPHKITVDHEGHVWIADNGAAPGRGHQVLKFNPSGELIMTLGTAGVAGDGNFIDQWFQFGRPSGIHIDANDVLYVADSESRDARTNIGRPLMDRRYNLGARRGIRIGSARDGTVHAFIADPCPYPYPGISSMAEGVTVDADGNVYGAEWLGTVRKYVRK